MWSFNVLQDPKTYVQTILDTHKMYNALVMTAFSNDTGFVQSLDKVNISCFYTISLEYLDTQRVLISLQDGTII